MTDTQRISQIIGDLQILEGKRIELTDELDELKLKVELPKMQKMYVGKYFKYNNGYSNSERWWLYFKVTGIKDLKRVITNSFETDNYGKSNFEVGKDYSTNLLDKKITAEEYNTALRKFRLAVNKL